ncbi:MAG: four-carbon acid sugar kinase family protein [Verrucomicrobia bacterium]|nr:four-carbon acid sugar kinase family protein [Verrucomicrobiota bacterium]
MAPAIVIVADDLTGAADCGAVYTEAGLDTVVVFGEVLRAWDCAADVTAVDADTRRAPPELAATVTERIVRELCSGSPAPILYKKIDSTLRGNFAVEIAAARRAYGDSRGSAKAGPATISPAPFTIVAPAFPATGRTTRDGRMFVQGVPMEEGDVWRKEKLSGIADVSAILRARTGLRVETVPLEVVRAGVQSTADILTGYAASGVEAVVCDADLDDDLSAVAQAAARLNPLPVFAGSAGLARHLPAALGLIRKHPADCRMRPGFVSVDAAASRSEAPARTRGPLLFVIGSVSEVARAQLDRLALEPGITIVTVPPAALRAGPGENAWQAAVRQADEALDAQRDVAIVIGTAGEINLDDGAVLSKALAQLVLLLMPRQAGLFCTGGETARAVFDAAGISGIRLAGEVEPGVPLGTGVGDYTRIPIITKAGAFGHPETLVRCRAALGGFP